MKKGLIVLLIIVCAAALVSAQNITNKIGATGKFIVYKNTSDTLLKVHASDGFFATGKVAFTPEGGIAVKMTNRDGGALVKGTLVTALNSAADGGVAKNPIATPDRPFGVVYQDANNGEECWIVVAGIADILVRGSVQTYRGWVAIASTTTAGQVEVSNDPGGSGHDKECGHFIEQVTSSLAKVVLHFR